MAYDATIRRYVPVAVLDLRAKRVDSERLASEVNLPLPPRANSYADGDHWRGLWVGPDHWIFLGTAEPLEGVAHLNERPSSKVHLSLADLTDAYEAFEIAGPDIQPVLAQATPLNLNPEALPNDFASFTYFFGRRVVLMQEKTPGVFTLLAARSYGDYLEACLSSAQAGPFRRLSS